MLIKLLVAALMLAWIQLPVLKERTQSQLSPEWGTPLRAVLDTVDTAVGSPVAELWAVATQGKADVAKALAALTPPPLPDAVALDAPPPVPVVVEGAQAIPLPARLEGPKTASPPGNITPAAPVVPTAPAPSVPAIAESGAPPSAEAAGCVIRLDRKQPATIVMMGDSLMGNIAGSLKRWADKHTAWKVVDAHKVSTGLANQEYYNWPKQAEALLTETPAPTLAVMLVGTNDAQDIVEHKQRRRFSSEDWAATYQDRMSHIAQSAEAAQVPLVWLGMLPVHNPDLAKKIAQIATVQRAGARRTAVRFIEVGQALRDKDGNLRDKSEGAKPRSLWAEDGTHLSSTGADLVVQALLPQVFGTDCVP